MNQICRYQRKVPTPQNPTNAKMTSVDVVFPAPSALIRSVVKHALDEDIAFDFDEDIWWSEVEQDFVYDYIIYKPSSPFDHLSEDEYEEYLFDRFSREL